MCGRYSNHVKAMLDWSAILGSWPAEIVESHNIAPGQVIAAFTQEGGAGMRWGLIPSWSDEVAGKYSTFNARIETINAKPAFRHAWSHSQRCLIPALGYFEWRSEPAGKQPYFIHAQNLEPILFAGIFESARDDGIPASCTILTQAALPQLAAIHSRMPVLMPVASRQRWLDCSPEEAFSMATGTLDVELQYYPVSKQVNNARNEGDDLIEAIELPAS